MTRNQIASLLAKREGKKSQVKIGDIREILRLLVELDAELFGEVEKGPLMVLEEDVTKLLASWFAKKGKKEKTMRKK